MINARNRLAAIPELAHSIAQALDAELAKINAATAWSDTHKAEQATKARARAAEALTHLRGALDTSRAALDAYTVPQSTDPATEARITRAAGRVARALDAGAEPHDLIAQAAADRDLTTLAALREELPGRIIAQGRRDGLPGVAERGSHADKLATLHYGLDVATARAMAGTPEGAKMAAKLTGAVLAKIADRELTAATQAAEGRPVDPMGHAVERHYAAQELAQLTAQIEGTDTDQPAA